MTPAQGGNVTHARTRLAGAALVLLTLALLALAAPPVARSAAPGAQEILDASDRTRNGWSSFAVDVTITDEGATGPRAVTKYQVLIKGSERTLVKFSDPSDKGKLLLMVEEGMWFYLPSTSRPIRVTPLQRLAGNASNGDVAQTSLAANYAATLVGEETLGGEAVWVLELTAKRKGATYQGVRYWVSKERALPLQAEYRLTSGKATKRAHFEKYEVVNGQRMLQRQVIVDLLRRDRRTVLEFRNYKAQELPDKFFNKNYLGEL
jgi:outer membrane lipoprotein-sorting protein